MQNRFCRTSGVVETQSIGALTKLNDYGIFGALRGVVFEELRTQPPRLYSNQRVQVRIEIRGAAEDFGRDLIFLKRHSGILQRMVSQITQQLTKRLGTMQGMAVHQPLHLGEVLLLMSYMAGNAHLTESNKLISSPARQQLRRSNRNKPSETYKFFESEACYGAIW